MISRTRPVLALLCLLCLTVCGLVTPAVARETFTFVYVDRADDPFYEPHRLYTGLTLRDRYPPIDGARTAIKESRIVGRAAGKTFALSELTLGDGQDAVGAIERQVEETGARVFILDLPIEEMIATAKALSSEDLILFNVRHEDDALRGADCSPVLFHTLPSRAMRMDALAQFLRKRTWDRVLLLAGPTPEDEAVSAAFQASAHKFGLRVAEVRHFLLSNDPRQRDQTNIPLLTGEVDYDVVFLADETGEFGRYVPYQTQLPRPVVGSEGLAADAWHWTWERNGAPQLNRRFDRIAKRRMSATDWSAWAAVKSIVEAIVHAKATGIAQLRDFLTSPAFTLDTYKGTPGNFRPWDNQLRQPILLHTHNAVIARAPIEGFLHEVNNLDTLGADLRDTTCHLK